MSESPTTPTTSPARLVRDPGLIGVAEKVLAGIDLGHADGVALYASRDVHGIGRLAHLVRTRLHGDRAYYNRNRHINYTNVCARVPVIPAMPVAPARVCATGHTRPGTSRF